MIFRRIAQSLSVLLTLSLVNSSGFSYVVGVLSSEPAMNRPISLATEALMLPVMSAKHSSITAPLWAWAGRLEKTSYRLSWFFLRKHSHFESLGQLSAFLSFTSFIVVGFVTVFVALLNDPQLYLPGQKRMAITALLSVEGISTGVGLAGYCLYVFCSTYGSSIDQATTFAEQKQWFRNVRRDMITKFFSRIPGTSDYKARLNALRDAKQKYIEDLRSDLSALSGSKDRESLALRILFTEELVKLNSFIPSSLQPLFDTLPTLGSQQAAFWATWLYYQGHFSLDDLEHEIDQLSRWEASAQQERGLNHFLGLEVHSAIPEFLDGPYRLEEFDLQRLDLWFENPDTPWPFRNTYQERRLHENPKEAALSTLNEWLDRIDLDLILPTLTTASET